MRLVIALVVWVAAIAAAVAVSSAVSSSIHKTSTTVGANGTSVSVGGNSGSGVDPSSVKSTDAVSLFHTANLERALAKARSALGANAKIGNFVIYPGYLSITAAKGAGEVDFYIDANGRVEQTSDSGNPGDSLFRLSQVSPAVPAALVHRIATAAHVPESQLHYVVVDVDGESNKLEWLIYGTETSPAEYFKAPGAKGQLLELKRGSSTGLQPVSG
jgi:hypothetical protein